MDEIDDLRARIDEIDSELVHLMNERAKLALEVGQIKITRGMQIHNPRREAAVLRRVKEENSGPLCHEAVQRIFRQIIEECRRIEIIDS